MRQSRGKLSPANAANFLSVRRFSRYAFVRLGATLYSMRDEYRGRATFTNVASRFLGRAINRTTHCIRLNRLIHVLPFAKRRRISAARRTEEPDVRRSRAAWRRGETTPRAEENFLVYPWDKAFRTRNARYNVEENLWRFKLLSGS